MMDAAKIDENDRRTVEAYREALASVPAVFKDIPGAAPIWIEGFMAGAVGREDE